MNIVPPLPFVGPLGIQSVVVPPAILGDADGLRLAAVHLESAAVDLDWTVKQLRNTVLQLTAGGDWTGAGADAFAQRMVEPATLTLSGVARELERIAGVVRRGATAIEEAQSEYRRAELMAVATGVLVAVGALAFPPADVVAADAAETAAAMMTRAAATAASGVRAVIAAMAEVETAIGALGVRLTTGVVSAAAVAPKLMDGPVAAGLFGALSTAGVGDMSPADWAEAFGLGLLEGKLAHVGGEAEEPVVPGLTKTGVPRLYPYDLEWFEGVDRAHVIAVHCRETAPELIDRLEFDPKPKKVSAFPDRARAQEAVQEAIDRHQDEIATWLHNSDTGERLVRDSTLEETTGEVLTRLTWKKGEKPRTTTMVEFVLQRRRASPLGFVVLTAYPTLSEPPSK